MTTSAILQQPTFSTGEVSSSLYGRVDLQRYTSSLRLCKNMLVKAEGGITKRPGTRFVAPTKNTSGAVNLVPFQPTSTDGYMIEFGDQYARFHINGGLVLDSATDVVTTDIQNPAGTTARFLSGTTVVAGDQYYMQDNDSINPLQGRFVKISATGLSAGVHFQLEDWETGDAVEYDAAMAGGTITLRKPYEIATPYLAADVADLSYAQSVDVLYIANANYTPRKLQRTALSPLTFELETVGFNQRLARPRIPTSSGWSGAYPNGYASENYVITYVDKSGDSGLAESLPSNPITGSRDANWASTGSVATLQTGVTKATAIVDTRATHARLYKRVGSRYIFLEEKQIPAGASAFTFEDRNLTPVSTTSPPSARNPFAKRFDYSSALGSSGGTGPVVGDFVITEDFAMASITVAGTDPVEIVTAAPHTVTPGTELDIFLSPNDIEADLSYRVFRATALSNTVFQLIGTDSSNYTGGAVLRGDVCLKAGTISETKDATITDGTLFVTEFLGSFENSDVIYTISSAEAAILFTFYTVGATTGGTVANVSQSFPSVVTFFEDRLVWAASSSAPQTVWTSQSGDYENLSVSSGIVASDAVTFTINSRQLNTINAMVSLDDLILMTSGAVWSASGAGENEPLSPDSIKVRVQSYAGAVSLSPTLLDDSVLFVEAKSQAIRDLNYEFTVDKYTGNDLSIMSRHLIEDYSITDWCSQKVPYGMIWMVRDDGKVLGLTYLKEHDVRGWSQHTFGDSVSAIGSVSGLTQDDVYMVVTRGARRHIEYLEDRRYGSDIKDAWFVDDGVNASFSAKNVWGLWHLEGETLSALVDGNVEEGLVVSNGAVTLTNAATSKVIIGSPFTGEMTTLDLNVDAGGGALHAQRRRVAKIFIRTVDTRGVFVAEDGTSPLNELKQRTFVPNTNIAAAEGVFEIVPASEWSRDGRVHLEFPYPVPAEITSVMPLIVVGG